ncbi:MAG: hypothetical protein MUO89_04490 [Dehalococcoidia bacterium]|nr:hypothetical protein [Dehalococcoidia bacterium]
MSQKEVKLAPEQKEKLLRNIWVAHDGRWLLKSAGIFGFDVANKLNFAVQESIGKTETKQLLAETGYREIKNIEDLKALIELAAPLYFPEEHKYQLEIIDDNTLLGRVLECYVHQMVSKAGTTEIHQCAGKLRFQSWLKGLGLNGEVINEKNTNICNGTCDIFFKIKW